MKLTHRQVYILVVALIAFLTALDAGVFAGVFGPVSQLVKDGAIVLNMALGVVCAVLPAWNNPSAPIPSVPKPPPAI